MALAAGGAISTGAVGTFAGRRLAGIARRGKIQQPESKEKKPS
jgi:hypothetical protein